MDKIIISIEGNIGVGKSTFIQLLKENIENCDIVNEPIEEWKNLKDTDGTNILEKFYKDIPRWAYTFQNLACITRMTKIEDTINKSNAKYIFIDRSLGTDKNVFEKMLYDNDKISEIEHNIYNFWCDFYHKYIRSEFNNIIIYLRCNPYTSFERIIKRGREEEKDISIDYLQELHKYHEEWLYKDDENIIIINCDKDFENDSEYKNAIINDVVNKINVILNKKYNLQQNKNEFCNYMKKL